MDWDNLRYVLAVHRSGSALQAACELGVNQSTVTRRIAQLEKQMGVRLFERRQSGYVATPLGVSAAQAAERVEQQVRELQSAMAESRRVLAGTVRLTASETMADRLVAPCLRPFHKQHPDIRIELIADDRRLGVAQGEADVALRAGSRPEGSGIVVRRMPNIAWAVYCSRGYSEEFGAPRSRDKIGGHAVIGAEGHMARLPAPRWVEQATERPIRFRSNSLGNLVSSLRADLGVAALPCLVGDAEPDLIRCFPPPPELDAELWLIVREARRTTPAVRAVADYLGAFLVSIRGQLTGGRG